VSVGRDASLSLDPMRGLARPSTEVVKACFAPSVCFFCFLVRLRFALRNLALCSVCAIAPSFVSGSNKAQAGCVLVVRKQFNFMESIR
jgi:hypothetical protein